jgi:multiple sugar transport system substrate-binding protein
MSKSLHRRFIVAAAVTASLLVTLLPTQIATAAVTKITINVNQSPWLNAYKKLILDYTKETGIEVDVRVFPYPEMRPTLVADIQATNRTYDVYQYDELFTHEFAANKWVKPFKQVDPNFKMDPNIGSYGNFMYWNPIKKFSDPKGDVMSMPLNGNTTVFLYRKDIYAALGLKVPTTWDEVLANSAKIKAADVVKYPYIIRAQAVPSGSSVTYDYMHILASYGGRFFNKEGEDYLPVIKSKEGIAAATTFRALAKYGPPATNTIGQSQVIAAMQAGDAAQGQVVIAAANAMNDPAQSRVAGKIGFAVMPKGCETCNPGVVSGTWAMSIPAGLTAEREQAALKYINWVLSKKAQIKFAEYGGVPTRTDVISEANLTTVQREYLDVYQKGLPFVTNNVRELFAPAMLAATESRLGAIAAGSVTPRAGITSLDNDLKSIVRSFDYAMNESRITTIVCLKPGRRDFKITRAGSKKCPPGYTLKQ